MVILRSQNKITNFLIILVWAGHFNIEATSIIIFMIILAAAYVRDITAYVYITAAYVCDTATYALTSCYDVYEQYH